MPDEAVAATERPLLELHTSRHSLPPPAPVLYSLTCSFSSPGCCRLSQITDLFFQACLQPALLLVSTHQYLATSPQCPDSLPHPQSPSLCAISMHNMTSHPCALPSKVRAPCVRFIIYCCKRGVAGSRVDQNPCVPLWLHGQSRKRWRKHAFGLFNYFSGSISACTSAFARRIPAQPHSAFDTALVPPILSPSISRVVATLLL